MLRTLVILVVYHSFTCSKRFVAKQILKVWNQDSAHAFPEHEAMKEHIVAGCTAVLVHLQYTMGFSRRDYAKPSWLVKLLY
jgi:capsule polysaccharide export protein KpsE/RkpR